MNTKTTPRKQTDLTTGNSCTGTAEKENGTSTAMKKVLEIGVLLSSERDLNLLLEKILSSVMELAHCNAGTLYLRDGDFLRFKIMRNDVLHTYSGGDGKEPDLPPVPLTRENVCALALLEDRTINIEDVYNCRDYDFSGPIRYDSITGYHTQSMLVVPMRNRTGEKIGVLQLINALDAQEHVCAFPQEMELVLESLASQAAITIQNVYYIRQIKELFQSFVRVMSSAVDERTPYNGSHTRHMALYGSRFLDYLNQQAKSRQKELPFPPKRKEELLMSVWLHDIGKLVTPLEVMNKMNRLLPEQYQNFLHRMELIRLYGEIEKLKGLISEEEEQALSRQIKHAQDLVEQLNKAGFLSKTQQEELELLAKRTYLDKDGQKKPWLLPEEYHMLSIPKGNLSQEERKIMEEHVVITDKLLAQIQFSDEFSHVREWAASHHELLNGSGYPKKLSGEEIPVEVRIITILDIFDALVADDRPYKPGMPLEKALSILTDMAQKEGTLDPELTRQFIESRCWEEKS